MLKLRIILFKVVLLNTICNYVILSPLFEQKWILIVFFYNGQNKTLPLSAANQHREVRMTSQPQLQEVKVSVLGTTFINLSGFCYSGFTPKLSGGRTFLLLSTLSEDAVNSPVVKFSGIQSHPDSRCCPRVCWLTAATISKTTKRKWVLVGKHGGKVGSVTTGQLLRRFRNVKCE